MTDFMEIDVSAHNFHCKKCCCIWEDVDVPIEMDTSGIKCPDCKTVLEKIWQPVMFKVN